MIIVIYLGLGAIHIKRNKFITDCCRADVDVGDRHYHFGGKTWHTFLTRYPQIRTFNLQNKSYNSIQDWNANQ